MTLDFMEELERLGLPIFTVADVVRITGRPRNYCWLFLSRLVSRGRAVRIERGKYCLKGADPYEVASNLVFPSYVSFLSALAFHRLTTQIPVEIQIACTRQKRPLEFGGMRIVFVRLKRAAMFGFRRAGNAFVAEPEKAIIDCLYLPERGPVSEAWHAIKHGEIDAERIQGFAERLGSVVVVKRLGYLLERAGLQTRLRPAPTTKADLLSPGLPAAGERSARWRLIINEVLE